MRKYELVTIFDLEEVLDTKINFIKETFNSNNVTIVEEKDMGEREFSYPIKEKKRGHYYLFIVELDQKNLLEIEKAFKLYKRLLRYLFVKVEK